DSPSPILAYGKDKLAVEQYILNLNVFWTILRLTKVISGTHDNRNLLSQWLTSIENGELIRCATDQLLTPVDLQHVIEAIIFVIENSETGLFHVSGSEIVSRYELLQQLLQYVPKPARRRIQLEKCTLSEINFYELLPRSCSLSNAKFTSRAGMIPRRL